MWAFLTIDLIFYVFFGGFCSTCTQSLREMGGKFWRFIKDVNNEIWVKKAISETSGKIHENQKNERIDKST